MGENKHFKLTLIILVIWVTRSIVLAQTNNFETECKPVDLVFVVDSSGSINDHHQNNYNLVKLFLKSLSAQLNVGPHPNQSHVAVVIYSETSMVVFGLDQGSNLTKVNNSIDKMVYLRSSTDIAGGVQMARTGVFGKNGDRPEVMDMMVVISDGMATVRKNETLKEANMAKDKNIHIVTVGITNKIDSKQLTNMSSNNQFLMIDSFQKLNMEVYRNSIINATCFKPVRKVLDPVGVCEFANVVFVVDGSGSINDNDQNTFKTALQHSLDVISTVAIGSTGIFASLVTFNEVAEINLELSQRYAVDSVIAQISGVKFKGGRTNIAVGLSKAVQHIKKVTDERDEFAHNIIVLITDGHSTMKADEVIPAAKEAKKHGIYVLVASVTSRVNKELLRRVSTNYSVYDATLPNSAQVTINKIVNITCTPRALACEQLDIVFLLDSSGSINDDNATNFDRIKTFVKNVTRALRVGPYNHQIGAVTYSDYARFEFFLREGQSMAQVLNHIDRIRYIGGLSDAAGGFEVVQTQMFGDIMNGDRWWAKNVIIAVSDGHTRVELEVLEQVLKAGREGTYVLTAAVGSYANKERLRYISFNGDVVDINNATKMTQALQHIVMKQCTHDGDCGQFDITFILDNSDSMSAVSDSYWKDVKQFVMDVTGKFNIDPYFGSHVAVVSFGDSARIEFSLNEARNNEEAKKLIESLEQLQGRSDLTSAIKLTDDKIYNSFPFSGDRAVIPNIVIIVTDGHVNKGRDDLEDVAKELMEKATVIVLGLSQNADKETLRYISHEYIHVKDAVLSKDIIDEVKEKVCEKAKDLQNMD